MSDLHANKLLVASHFDAIWSGDDDAIRAQLAEGFVDHSAMPGMAMGSDGVTEGARRMRAVFPDMTVTIDHAVAEGDFVAVNATWRGTQRGTFQGIAPTNRTIAFTGMVLWRIVDGRLAERWAQLDLASAMRQLQAST